MEKGRCYWLDDDGNCIREWNEAKKVFPCRKRPSVCDDYSENFLGEPVFKVGDEVFYFDNEGFPSICLCKIVSMEISPAGVPMYHIMEITGRRVGTFFGHSLFQTKEALKEYYRKIFE